MKKPISDKDVLQVLNSLKNSENSYPQDLIESRRGAFTQQAAAMALLINAGTNGANTTGKGQSASTTTSGGTASGVGGASMGKILETALVVALIAEAGVSAYAYREKIADFFSSIFEPKVEQVENSSDTSPNFNTNNEPSTDIPTATPTVNITETPFPPGNTLPAQTGDNNGDSQVVSTPTPTDDGNGLHLGQTKQPSQEPKKNNDNNKNK